MERSAVHLVIVGRVQGVAFRMRAVAEATRLGLSGWVRNRMDGTVEARAEGAPEAPEALAETSDAGDRRGDDEEQAG